MFMQSFENSTKQQKRRSDRQAAMQRMNEAAQIDDDIAMTSVPSINEEEAKHDPSSINAKGGDARVSQLLMDIVANPASSGDGGGVASTRLQTGYRRQNSAGVAPSGSRFSVMEKTAQAFMWDDGSVASGATNKSGRQVNLHDIKKSLQSKSTSKWSRNTSARWNAINSNARQNEPVSEGLWSSLPLFGKGKSAPENDAASVRSSSSSKYRDQEGERLLGIAAQRLSKNESVSLNTSIEEKEYGENDSDDEEIEMRHRVVLDREGNLHYEDDDYEDLHARRMNNQRRRSIKRSLTCSLAILVCVGIMVTFGLLITQRLTKSQSAENDNGATSYDQTETDDAWAQQNNNLQHSDRFEAIKTNLLKMRVTHPSAFDDVHSAQHAALKWLADDDPRQLHPWSEFISQRYGLVTLWFSTTETEYEWHVPAEYNQNEGSERLRRLESNDGTSLWNKHENWLSDKGICEWEGVKCNIDDVGSNEEEDGDVSRLELKNNNMHGLICKEIYTTLPHLTYADFSNNGFTGILSKEIGLWNILTNLNFTANRIGGSIPPEIGEISQLKSLHFADNLLAGTIPHTIGDLTNLRELDLSGNELKGTIPYELGNLNDLISLDLASNKLKGDIPHEFSKLSLVTLDVGGNNLGGPLVTEIGLMSHLEVLRVNDNHLSGEIPTELGRLKHLNELCMYGNQFSGRLPSELSELVGLDSLILSDNRLEGEIPLELTKLSGLQRLDLSNNKLKGEVPVLIYDMKDLKELNLAKNNFSGSIPTLIGSLFKLETIQLETNLFEGSIPSQLGELTNLKKLLLHNNMLTGTVSSQLCELVEDRFLSFISADCAGQSAFVDCDCCQCHAHENIVHAGD